MLIVLFHASACASGPNESVPNAQNSLHFLSPEIPAKKGIFVETPRTSLPIMRPSPGALRLSLGGVRLIGVLQQRDKAKPHSVPAPLPPSHRSKTNKTNQWPHFASQNQ